MPTVHRTFFFLCQVVESGEIWSILHLNSKVIGPPSVNFTDSPSKYLGKEWMIFWAAHDVTFLQPPWEHSKALRWEFEIASGFKKGLYRLVTANESQTQKVSGLVCPHFRALSTLQGRNVVCIGLRNQDVLDMSNWANRWFWDESVVCRLLAAVYVCVSRSKERERGWIGSDAADSSQTQVRCSNRERESYKRENPTSCVWQIQ